MKIEAMETQPGTQTCRGLTRSARLNLAKVDRGSLLTVSILPVGIFLIALWWPVGNASLSAAAEESGVGKNPVRSFQVFLFAGQSNMAGADSIVSDPPGFVQQEAESTRTFFTGSR